MILSGLSREEAYYLCHTLTFAQSHSDLPGEIRGEFYDLKREMLAEYGVLCVQVSSHDCAESTIAEIIPHGVRK